MTEKTEKTGETTKRTSSRGKKEQGAGPAPAAGGGAAPGAAVSSRSEKAHGPAVSPKPAASTATGVGSAVRRSGSLRIRQIRSGICAPVEHKQTLAGLGLRRIRQEVVREDTPTVRGQIHKIRHLVTIVGTV
jgi:large subunit ribosomal protein L30